MLVTSLSLSNLSLLYHQSNNSENLPGGSGFIPQDRFTYLTVGIISVTLLLGILFPQSKYHVNKQNTRSSFCSSVTAFSCYCLVAFPCIKTKRKHKLLKKKTKGEQGWCSGEINYFPLMWPRFDILTHHHNNVDGVCWFSSLF